MHGHADRRHEGDADAPAAERFEGRADDAVVDCFCLAKATVPTVGEDDGVDVCHGVLQEIDIARVPDGELGRLVEDAVGTRPVAHERPGLMAGGDGCGDRVAADASGRSDDEYSLGACFRFVSRFRRDRRRSRLSVAARMARLGLGPVQFP